MPASGTTAGGGIDKEDDSAICFVGSVGFHELWVRHYPTGIFVLIGEAAVEDGHGVEKLTREHTLRHLMIADVRDSDDVASSKGQRPESK